MTGVEALEVMKASGRMPREQYNELLEQLLDEIKRSGREIKKGKRLMIVGNDVHNSKWIAAIEELDAVVVTDEMITELAALAPDSLAVIARTTVSMSWAACGRPIRSSGAPG